MFKTAEEIDEPVAYGRVAEYSGGGFLVTNTSKSLEDMQLLMAQLQEANWIDERTRAIFVDFTIYNANLQVTHAATPLTRPRGHAPHAATPWSKECTSDPSPSSFAWPEPSCVLVPPLASVTCVYVWVRAALLCSEDAH